MTQNDETFFYHEKIRILKQTQYYIGVLSFYIYG